MCIIITLTSIIQAWSLVCKNSIMLGQQIDSQIFVDDCSQVTNNCHAKVQSFLCKPPE